MLERAIKKKKAVEMGGKMKLDKGKKIKDSVMFLLTVITILLKICGVINDFTLGIIFLVLYIIDILIDLFIWEKRRKNEADDL
jgi:hypothetical protein